MSVPHLILCVLYMLYLSFFFFKQKTAYEMRISDWSSDVCSSDLRDVVARDDVPSQDVISRDNVSVKVNAVIYFRVVDPEKAIIRVENFEIGRASCRERVCQYV